VNGRHAFSMRAAGCLEHLCDFSAGGAASPAGIEARVWSVEKSLAFWTDGLNWRHK